MFTLAIPQSLPRALRNVSAAIRSRVKHEWYDLAIEGMPLGANPDALNLTGIA
jgi:hypothetical protein